MVELTKRRILTLSVFCLIVIGVIIYASSTDKNEKKKGPTTDQEENRQAPDQENTEVPDQGATREDEMQRKAKQKEDCETFKTYECAKSIELYSSYCNIKDQEPVLLRILDLDQEILRDTFGEDHTERLECLLLKASETRKFLDMMQSIEELRIQGTPEALSRADALKRTLVEATFASQFRVTFGDCNMLGGFEGINPPPRCISWEDS